MTLGTPNNAPPPDSPVAALDQTRGLLTFINDNFAGGYPLPPSKVSCVAGSGTEVTFPSPCGHGFTNRFAPLITPKKSYSHLCGSAEWLRCARWQVPESIGALLNDAGSKIWDEKVACHPAHMFSMSWSLTATSPQSAAAP